MSETKGEVPSAPKKKTKLCQTCSCKCTCNKQTLQNAWQRFLDNNRFVVKYNDRRYLIFRDVICFLNFFSIVLIIFQAAFHDSNPVLMILSYLIDGVMLVNIYISFRITYVNQNGQVIQNFQVLFKKYLRSKTGFIIDLMAALPVEAFAVFGREYFWSVLLILRLWHVLRLYRLLEYFRKWEQELNINVLFVRSCKFLVLFTLVTHTLACLWYNIACPLDRSCIEGSWVDFTEIHEEGEMYITTVYWTIATMTSTGYGDVAAHSIIEMIYAIFVMMVGKLLFGFILANIASTLSNAGVYQVQYDLQIQSVRSHMVDQGVPSMLHHRVVNYFNYLWMRNKGKNQHQLLNDCPTCLRAEVCLSITRPMLETIELFESMSESFLRRISQHVVPVFFMPGDYIAKSGDISKHAYYIHRGEVNVISESTQHIMAVLRQGDVFGEVSLVGNLPRRITVRAVTHVDIYSLSKKSMDRTLHHYPEMKLLFGSRAQERFGKLFEHCGIKLDMKM